MKLNYDGPLSYFAFKFKLRRYDEGRSEKEWAKRKKTEEEADMGWRGSSNPKP